MQLSEKKLNLALELEKRNLSKAQLSRATGIKKSTLGRIEKGDTKKIQPRTILAIERALKDFDETGSIRKIESIDFKDCFQEIFDAWDPDPDQNTDISYCLGKLFPKHKEEILLYLKNRPIKKASSGGGGKTGSRSAA